MTTPSHTELAAQRAAFEREYEAYCQPAEADWFRREDDDPDEYYHVTTKEAWWGWQASWKATAAALESPERVQGERIAGLERCEFDDECEFCQSPQGGSFTRLVHNAEDCTESEFYICGDCAWKAVDAFRIAPTPPTAPAQDAQGDDVLAARALAKSFRENPREASLKEQKVMNRAIRDPLTNRAFNMDGCATPSPQAEKQPLSEADEALMRQALGALKFSHPNPAVQEEKQRAITALRARLETSNV